MSRDESLVNKSALGWGSGSPLSSWAGGFYSPCSSIIGQGHSMAGITQNTNIATHSAFTAIYPQPSVVDSRPQSPGGAALRYYPQYCGPIGGTTHVTRILTVLSWCPCAGMVY